MPIALFTKNSHNKFDESFETAMKHVNIHLKTFLPIFFLITSAFVITLYLLQNNLQIEPVQKKQTQEQLAQQNVLAGETGSCVSGWNARKKVSFSGSTTTSLSNFPVLVKLDANRINYSKTRDNGADLRFEDPSAPGTFLPYEIETWNPSGTSYVWVKVPQVDATGDYIWMYYNNPSATDGQNRNAVWDSSFKGVWHLGSIFYDSTSNANNGTNHGTTAGAGQMGNASNFAGSSTADQYISVPNSESINFGTSQNYTIEAWVKLPQDQNYRTYPDNDIISKWTHDTSPPVNPYPYNLRTTNSSSTGGAGEIYANRYDANGVNPNCSSLPNKFNNNTWLHVAAIKFGSNLHMYVNGSQVCAATDTTIATTTNSDPLHFGRRVSARNWLTGSIDEVRISNTNRSADWVKAAYNTSRDAMNSFGTEESCAAAPDNPINVVSPTITPTKTPTPTLIKTPTPTLIQTINQTTTLVKTPTPIKSPTPASAWNVPQPTVNYGSFTSNRGGVAELQAPQPGVTTYLAPTEVPVDRLASQDPTVTKCISSLLTSDELNRLRYLQPKVPSEESDLNALQERVKVCFQSYTEVVKIQEASKQISELPQATKQCVVNAVGLNSYEQIQGGVRQPTQQEKVNTQSCFASQPQVEVTYQTNDKPLNNSTDACLVLALGNDKYAKLKSGQLQQSLEDREKIKRCFGANPNPLSNKPKYVLAPEIDSCMKKESSETRIRAIRAGIIEPTEEEKAKVNQCFGQINEVQAKLLPPPPQQVPYLKQDTQKINIAAAAPTTETTSESVTDNLVILRGKAAANTLVSVYVFSDPIVVETVTDKNGDWVYKLNEPLEKGTHLAYATIRSESGEQVRSSVFNFNVAYAAVPTNVIAQQYFEETSASEIPSKFIDSSMIMIGGSVVLAIIVIWIVVLKSQTAKNPAPGVQPPPSPFGQNNTENKP